MAFYNIEWVSNPSDTPDKYGNHWYTVKIEGRNIRMLAKEPPTVGQVYGDITKEVAKTSGKEYYRLRRKQIPDGVAPPATASPGGVAGIASKSSDILKLLRDNNRMLKALTGELEANEPEERGDDSGKDEVILDDDIVVDDDEPVDLSDIPF